MSTAVIEKTKEPEVEKNNLVGTAEQYVRRAFPMEKDEVDVKYCSVGVNKFRINFYSDRNKGVQSFMRDLHIGRSYYVVCTEGDDGWTHKII
jgi:Tfp pilus assembly pilus retraction ATPase PilT